MWKEHCQMHHNIWPQIILQSTTVTKATWSWYKNKHADKQNRTENSEINAHRYFSKNGVKNKHRKKLSKQRIDTTRCPPAEEWDLYLSPYTKLKVNRRATGNTEMAKGKHTENTWYSYTWELFTQNTNSRAMSPRTKKQND